MLSNSGLIIIEMVEFFFFFEMVGYLKHILSYRKVAGFRIWAR